MRPTCKKITRNQHKEEWIFHKCDNFAKKAETNPDICHVYKELCDILLMSWILALSVNNWYLLLHRDCCEKWTLTEKGYFGGIPWIFVNVKNFSIFLPENGWRWSTLGSRTNQTSCSTFDHTSVFRFKSKLISQNWKNS